MQHYGMRQNDISYWEAFGPDAYTGLDPDPKFTKRLAQAYSGDRSILESFDLWDWHAGAFVLVRPASTQLHTSKQTK
jgi:hypothetical protein